jgi:citrate lyase subunit beta/citryl-CoA lyase
MERPRGLPVWRSLLYVPVNVDRFVEKAHTRGADAVQLDLEDSIPPSEKEAARTLVQEAAAKVARGGADVVVRINRPLRMAIRDAEASVSPRVQALALPKVESADHVRLLSEAVSELEQERGMVVGATRFICMVETAGAFFQMKEIAAADNRVVALTVGAEDFALSVGMLPEPEGLLYPKLQSVIAARAAGVLPLGFVGTVADYKDIDAFRTAIRRSRRLGFLGASCIHPALVPVLNEEFSPTEAEVAQSRRIIAVYDEATAAGRGSIEVDGKMVDVPIVERARGVLARHEAIQARVRQQLGTA